MQPLFHTRIFPWLREILQWFHNSSQNVEAIQCAIGTRLDVQVVQKHEEEFAFLQPLGDRNQSRVLRECEQERH